MTRLRQTLVGAILLLVVAAAAHAGESSSDLLDLVRSLRVLQDEIASGSAEAHRAQQQKMAVISDEFSALNPKDWKNPRNQHAAMLYVASGGDPRVLRNLLAAGGLSADNEKLTRGVLAYAEGRANEAAKYLSSVKAQDLAPGIAGSIALIQAMTVAEADPGKALELLDKARLLSPGSLVEEVALRRQILLLPAAGQLDRLESLASRYARRFGKSYYASAFWRQLAALLAGSNPADERKWLTQFEDTFAALSGQSRRHFYLAIAQEAIARGRIGLARSAAGKAAQLADAGTVEALGAQLYEAAALIVTDEYERGLATLEAIAGEKLPAAESGLLHAALRVARMIRRHADPNLQISDLPSAGSASQRAQELSTIGLAVIARAKAILADTDAVLSGGT